MPAYADGRDITSFARRAGRLPGQEEEDTLDYRGLLNRDGSVISVVTAADLANDQQLYADLGCKTVVGMPFKDISTSDSLMLRVPPALDDTKARQTLKRLADVAVHAILPAAALAAAPAASSPKTKEQKTEKTLESVRGAVGAFSDELRASLIQAVPNCLS